MIVIASNLVPLPDESALPPGTPWIGWHNIVTPTNIVADSTLPGSPASNMANPSTNLFWWSLTFSNQYLTVTTNYNENIDYVGIARHNLGQVGATVSVEGAGPSLVFSEIVNQQILPDDSPVIFRFTPGVYSKIRLRIQTPVSAPAFPLVSVMYVGKLLICERSIKIDTRHVPIDYGRRAKLYSGFSESGNFLGRVLLQQHRESKAVFDWITPSWYRSKMDPFIAASKTSPFFFAWNPIEYPYEVGYAWMLNDPEPATDPVTRRVGIELDMSGVT